MNAISKFPKLFPITTIVGSLLIIGALFLPVMKVEWNKGELYDKFDEWSEQNQCEEMEDYEAILDYTCAETYDENRTDDKDYTYEIAYDAYIKMAGIPSTDNGISKLCEMQMIPGVACSVVAILLGCLLYWKNKMNRKIFYGVIALSVVGMIFYIMDSKNYVSDIIASQSLYVMPKLSIGISAWVFAAGNIVLSLSALGQTFRKNK